MSMIWPSQGPSSFGLPFRYQRENQTTAYNDKWNQDFQDCHHQALGWEVQEGTSSFCGSSVGCWVGRWIKFVEPLVDFLPCLRYLALLSLELPFKPEWPQCSSCTQNREVTFGKEVNHHEKDGRVPALCFRCELLFGEVLSWEPVCLAGVSLDLGNRIIGQTEAINYWWSLETGWWICTPLLSPLWFKCKWNLM